MLVPWRVCIHNSNIFRWSTTINFPPWWLYADSHDHLVMPFSNVWGLPPWSLLTRLPTKLWTNSWILDEIVNSRYISIVHHYIYIYRETYHITIHHLILCKYDWFYHDVSKRLVWCCRGNKCDLSSKKVVSYDEAKARIVHWFGDPWGEWCAIE